MLLLGLLKIRAWALATPSFILNKSIKQASNSEKQEKRELFNVATLGKGTRSSVNLPHPLPLPPCLIFQGPDMRFGFKQRARGMLSSPGQGVVLSLIVLAPVFL